MKMRIRGLLIVLSLVLALGAVGVYASPTGPVREVGVSNVFYIWHPGGERRVVIISLSDDNHVAVYSLDLKQKEEEFTLNALEPRVILPHGNYLKIVSDKPMMVYSYSLVHGWAVATYYPSTEGPYVGKSFKLFPVASFLRVYALEEGIIEISGPNGYFMSLPLIPDSYSEINFSDIWMREKAADEIDYEIYFEVESTGKVMLYGGEMGYQWYTVPSVGEGMVGYTHYGHTISPREFYGSILVVSYGSGELHLTNLSDPTDVRTYELRKHGDILYITKYTATPFKIESEAPVFVQTGFTDHYEKYNGFTGQHYAGGWINENGEIEYWFYVNNRGPACIFAPEDVSITVNGTTYELKADQYEEKSKIDKGCLLRLPGPGLWHIVSPKPLIIQLQPLDGYAVVPDGIPATHPEFEEAPTGADMTPIIIIVVVIVILAALGVFLLRRRKG